MKTVPQLNAAHQGGHTLLPRAVVHARVDQFTLVMDVMMAEASELGLTPGEWPQHILVTNSRGQVEAFEKRRKIECGFAYVHDSRTAFSTPLELHIIND